MHDDLNSYCRKILRELGGRKCVKYKMYICKNKQTRKIYKNIKINMKDPCTNICGFKSERLIHI